MKGDNKVFEILDMLGINYEKHEHPPVYTVEEANQYWGDLDGMHCKNLFLRDKKGKNHYLVVMEENKKLDFEDIARKINSDKLSFGSEKRLEKYLGLERGAVSPFGIINDEGNEVVVIVDEEIKSADSVNFHPNVNTATVNISVCDFIKFLEWSGNDVIWANL